MRNLLHLIWILVPISVWSQTKTVWIESKSLLPVTILEPTSQQPSGTLVMMFHGWGSSAERFTAAAGAYLEAGHLVAVPESTYAFESDGSLGYDWALYYRQDLDLGLRAFRLLITSQIADMLSALKQQHTFDRVYLMGFSQGAVVALLAGFAQPGEVDGVISFGLPAFEESWFDEAPELTQGIVHEDRPRVMLLHGKADQRAPADFSSRAQRFFESKDTDVTLVFYEGGHTLAEEPLNQSAAWIAKPGD